MTEDNLLVFSNWRIERKPGLEAKGFEVDLVDCEPTSNTAKRIDLEKDFLIATICVWESGAVEFDAIECVNEKTIFVDRADENISLIEKLDYYLDIIINR